MTSPHLHAVDARDAQAATPTATRPIPEIIAELKAGRMAVLVDEEDRENEGDLIVAADCVTPDVINFMAKHGRGLICMPITEARARALNLAPMTAVNRSVHGTNFTVSIEAAQGVTTGISAADRAHTIRVACAPDAKPQDIVHPGHVFPLVAQQGGVLARAGHTEACCDLARLAGHSPAAVLCEIMNDDGTMARLPDLVEFARQHALKIGAIVDLLDYGSRTHSWTIPAALAAIARTKCGVLVLLHRPESARELRQRAVADQPAAETRMDLRNYGIGAQILRDLNVGKMRLLARPRKMPSMAGFGLEVTGYDDVSAASRSSPR